MKLIKVKCVDFYFFNPDTAPKQQEVTITPEEANSLYNRLETNESWKTNGDIAATFEGKSISRPGGASWSKIIKEHNIKKIKLTLIVRGPYLNDSRKVFQVIFKLLK